MTTETATDTPTSDAQTAVVHAEGQASPGTAPAQSDSQQTVTTAFADEDAELAALEARIARGETGEETQGRRQAAGDQSTSSVDGEAADAGQAGGDGKPTQSADTGQRPKAPTDPKEAAIIALRKKTAEQDRLLAVREGELNALRSMVQSGNAANAEQPDAGNQEQQPTFEEQYAEIDNRKQELAVAVDKGTMSMADYVRETNALDAQKFELQKQELQELSEPQPDMALQQHTDKLLVDYPVLARLKAEDIAPYKALAIARAKAAGQPIGVGPVETARLRTLMAFLVERDYDPARHQQRVQRMQQQAAGRSGQNPGAKPGAGAGANGQQPGANGSRPTAAQREAKLMLAASHPVNIGETGAGGTTGEPTEAEAEAALMGKSEDEAIRWLDQHPGIAKKLGYANG